MEYVIIDDRDIEITSLYRKNPALHRRVSEFENAFRIHSVQEAEMYLSELPLSSAAYLSIKNLEAIAASQQFFSDYMLQRDVMDRSVAEGPVLLS